MDMNRKRCEEMVETYFFDSGTTPATMDSPANPYATPATADPAAIPEAPPDFGWAIENRRLVVETGARLPMVDPYTGRSSETMQLREVLLPNRLPWLRFLPLVTALVFVLLGAADSWITILAPLCWGALIGYLVTLVPSLFLPKCTLFLFFQPHTIRFRTIFDRTMSILLVSWLVGGIPMSLGPAWLQVVPGILFGTWVLCLAFSIFLQRRLTCHRRKDGRFQVRGIHSRAVIELMRSQ